MGASMLWDEIEPAYAEYAAEEAEIDALCGICPDWWRSLPEFQP